MTSIYWLHALALLVIVACANACVFISRQKWEETEPWWLSQSSTTTEQD